MVQLISKSWGFDDEGKSVRLHHYVADDQKDVLPIDVPAGSECVFADAEKAIFTGERWVILSKNLSSDRIRTPVFGKGQTLLKSCVEQPLSDLKVFGSYSYESLPTPANPVSPSFSQGVLLTCGSTLLQLPDLELLAVGSTADSLNSDGTVTRRIGKVILDGSENFNVMTGSYYFEYTYYYALPGAAVGNSTSLCSHFTNVEYAYQSSVGAVGRCCDHPSSNRKYFNSDIATVEEFKGWLAAEKAKGTPVTLWYLLEKEYTEPLSEQQLQSLSALRIAEGENDLSAKDLNGNALPFQGSILKNVSGVLAEYEHRISELEKKCAAV